MKNIDLENYLIMIHKIYNSISNERFEKILNTEVNSFQEICLLYLYELLKLICNRGLHRDYIKYEGVELNSPKGVINVQKSLENMTFIKGKLVCNYEELSYNNVCNQLIKYTINSVIKNKDISKNIINKYKQIAYYFNEVDNIELDDINTNILKNIKVNNKYSQAIKMCENINSINKPEQHKLKIFKEYIKIYYNDKLKTSKVYYKDIENTEYIIIESIKNIIVIKCELYNDIEYRDLNIKIKELDKIIKDNFFR